MYAEEVTATTGTTGALPGRERARQVLAGVPAEPGVPKPDPILVADHVVRRFGGLVAVDLAHLEIQQGSITALIGPNGAGKTTLFNVLTGFDRPQSGSWTFNGLPVHGRRAHQVARLGMVRTFQLTKALARLTVIDNMRLAATSQLGENFFVSLLPFLWQQQEREITARADELLRWFRLDGLRDEFAGALSGGQRKLLEMARALMVRPELILLDEPMAGVNPALTQSLLDHVRQFREDGMTVLFIEHDMDMVREISDWVVVMGEGAVIAEGTPEQVMADQRVIDAYLGAHHNGAVKTVAGRDLDAAEVPVPGAERSEQEET